MHPSQDFNRKWSLSLEFSFQTHGKLVVCPSSHWESWEADPSNDIYIFFLDYIDVKKEMHDKCQLFAGCTCIHRYTFLLINRYTDIYIYIVYSTSCMHINRSEYGMLHMQKITCLRSRNPWFHSEAKSRPNAAFQLYLMVGPPASRLTCLRSISSAALARLKSSKMIQNVKLTLLQDSFLWL